ncbi:hypothetical protein KI387_021138, partial [Taxus chinensis]
IVVDNATYFSSRELTEFFYGFGISLAHSSDYYPQGNGQAESSNKNIVTIVRKLVDENQRNWHKRLYDALWADRITPKKAIGTSPFQMLYGVEVEIPITIEMPALKLIQS